MFFSRMSHGSDEPLVTGAQDDSLVVVREEPFNAEAAPLALASAITPAGAHYVRAHFGPPPLDRRTYEIVVDGAVAQPATISLAALRALPTRSVTVTMECAGNERALLSPLPPGEPWLHGAVSTASWCGPPLGLVLERAGVRDDVVEILVEGADRGRPDGSAESCSYARALPLDVAQAGHVILALEMNGRPLPIEHGAPVRLVVPGWYGMASVKWVARISALTAPFAGFFQRDRYVYVRDGKMRPVELMRVKSMLVEPAPLAPVPRGGILGWGWAWSGAAQVVAVEVSLDGGPFRPDELDPPLAPHAWRRFSIELDVPVAGRHSLRCRARDAAGRVQPERAEWNAFGYGHHAVHAHLFECI
jgi:DMSO/TMAO reductase YedYZ molybdopterin-dependent catalytic subunit